MHCSSLILCVSYFKIAIYLFQYFVILPYIIFRNRTWSLCKLVNTIFSHYLLYVITLINVHDNVRLFTVLVAQKFDFTQKITFIIVHFVVLLFLWQIGTDMQFQSVYSQTTKNHVSYVYNSPFPLLFSLYNT